MNAKSTKNTETRIKEAALRLFATRGYEATGIRDVARDAGVKTSSLYHYMGTKEDLLYRLICEGMAVLLAGAQEATKDTATASQELEALVRAHVRCHVSRPLLALVIDNQYTLLTEGPRAEVEALRDEYEDFWAQSILRGMESEEFEVARPSLARLAILEMCNGVARWYRPGGRLSVDEITAEFTRLALRIVGYVGSRPSRVSTLGSRTSPRRR